MTDAFSTKPPLLDDRGADFAIAQAWPKYSGTALYELKQVLARFLQSALPNPTTDVISHVAHHTEIGSRKVQEDAVLVDVSNELRRSLCVVSDGMGGHNCGDVASRVTVDVVMERIKAQLTADLAPAQIREVLVAAAEAANDAIRDRMAQDAATTGMGCTLLVTVFCDHGLYWLSIGDSPLFLYRGGRLHQLNQDHSLAPQIDLMAKVGLMAAEEARYHPDRNLLTSALTGGDISRIDAHPITFDLRSGDIVLVASDGLQFLPNSDIERAVTANRHKSAGDLARCVVDAVMALRADDQDNIGLAVVKVSK